jgi:apolipoprotein N-acyltransferase
MKRRLFSFNPNKKPTLSALIIAIVAGGFLPFAFSPYGYWWLAIASPAVLLWLWCKASNQQQMFFIGWCYGLGKYGVGTSWVFISMHRFGGTSVWLSLFFTAAFVAFLALFTGGQGLLLRFTSKKNSWHRYLLYFPATWVITEWVLEWIFTGFPWLYLGDSQTNSPLVGFAPIVGPLGVSFIVALCAGLCVLILKPRANRWFASLGLIGIFALGLLCYQIPWSTPTGKPLRVSLVQSNVPQMTQWQPGAIAGIVHRYVHLSAPYWSKSDLIVWSENAIPLPENRARFILNSLKNKAKKTNTTLILGIPIPTKMAYYNALVMLGKNQGRYLKRHLVPFGEYIPFDSWLRGAIRFFDLPMSDFVAGPSHQPLLNVDGHLIAPFICYEIAYSELVRQDLPRAQLLLVISNDAWFGHSSAAWQQLQIAQMKSVSSARPTLTVTKNGVTAVINDKGQRMKTAPRFKPFVLNATVQPDKGSTPWDFWGHWPVLLLVFLLVFLGKINSFRQE